MASRRNGLALLAKVVAAAEPGTNNIGQYLEAKADELAPELAISASSLRAVAKIADEELAPQLAELLRQRELHHHRARLVTAAERASTAAIRLARSAVWNNNEIYLDVDLVLGDLLGDTRTKYIAFLFDEHNVAIERTTLVDVSRVLVEKRYADRLASIDTAGLHFRWNNGRGGLNFISRTVTPQERDSVLQVVLERPRVMAPRALPPRKGGAWLGEILAEMGLTT